MTKSIPELWREVRSAESMTQFNEIADQLESRLPGLVVTNCVARDCIEAAAGLDRFQNQQATAISTLRRAAAEIDRLQDLCNDERDRANSAAEKLTITFNDADYQLLTNVVKWMTEYEPWEPFAAMCRFRLKEIAAKVWRLKK